MPSRGILPDSIPQSALLLSDYIQYPSVTGNERQAGQYLATMAMIKGLHVEVFTNHLDTFNFAASLYPLSQNKPNIILLNHIDVVPALNAAEFTYPPFSGTIADGMVWGRGAIDNKGMAVMQLLAMQRFVELAQDQELPYNVTMVSVSGEETGGHTGAKVVASRFAHKLNPIVVFGEGGTGIPSLLMNDPHKKVFTISTTFKRSLWLKLNLKMNTSGHGSVPPKRYAVQEKVRALYKITRWNRREVFSKTTRRMFRELGRLEGGMRGLFLRNLGLFRPIAVRAMRKDGVIYSLITNTITITGIQTPPGAPNIIPQTIDVTLDCRLLPDVDTQEFIEEIRKVLDNSDVKIEVLQEDKMATPSDVGECFIRMANALKRVYPQSGVIPILMPASNDNNYFRALGVPTYGILPVFMDMEYIESIHNIDERIPIDALEKGTQVYVELLKQYLE
jgi:carboxypeptidase PM20D1